MISAPASARFAAILLLSALAAASTGCSVQPPREPRTVTTLRPTSGSATSARTSPASTATGSAAAPRRAPRQVVPDVIPKPRAFRIATAPPGPVALVSASEPAEPALLAETDSQSPAAQAEIREMLRGYLRAFNRHDSPALAAHWSGSGENIDLDTGEVTAGRDAVHDVFAALFEHDESATIDIDVKSVRTLRDDVAVVDGVSLISFADGTPASSRFSAVVVKEDGRWVLESVREAALPTPATAARPLDELAWLVGAWEDVDAGVSIGTQCTWSSGRAFLIRSHAVSADADTSERPGTEGVPALLRDGAAERRDVTEIIGWDSQRAALRSWVFTSSGRFAEGTWSRDGDTWTVHLVGLGDDAGRECTYTLAPLGPDEMSVRCAVAAGGSEGLVTAFLPACDFIRVGRAQTP